MNTYFDIDNEAYHEQLTQHIKILCTKADSKYSFHEIVTKSEGASPIAVKAVLDSLSVKYTFNKSAYIITQNAEPIIHQDKSILSDPHPADYDWRFNESTITKYLYDLALFSDKKIALLGTKTIFTGLIDRQVDATIFNKSSSLLDDFKNNGYNTGLVECDLFNPQPHYNNSFHLAIADPPWYPEFYEAFIKRSADFLQIGGLLHISVLKRLTRPYAEKDRENIIDKAQKVGLQLVEIVSDYFIYETPNFEKNTLATQALFCENWRKSDLFVFQKIDDFECQTESIANDSDESWIEFRWQNKKIKIRNVACQGEDIFAYESADPDNIVFTNVSRRSPNRKRIDIWTSDNFAFRVYKLKILISYFEITNSGKNHNETVLLLKEKFLISEQEALDLTKLIETILNDSSNKIFI